jgi:hypothetical protein
MTENEAGICVQEFEENVPSPLCWSRFVITRELRRSITAGGRDLGVVLL